MFTEDQKLKFREYLRVFAQGNNQRVLQEQIATLLNAARENLKHIVQQSYPILRNHEEDVVQETLKRAVKRGALAWLQDQYGENADPGIWLLYHMRYAASDTIRKIRPRQEGPEVSLEELLENGKHLKALPEIKGEPDQIRRVWDAVRGCLQNELDFQIVYLAVNLEPNAARIGQLLCIGHDNARQRLHYAFAKLRACRELVALYNEPGG
jgi:DNA-directed RNA polymerase specialized sigma24 family protein